MNLHRTSLSLAVIAGLALAVAPATQAADDYGQNVGTKFSRGLANTVTGWVELPKNIVLESEERNVLSGITFGTIKGAFHTVARTVVGAVELGTFFIPNDDIAHERYVWKDMKHETSYGS